MGPPVLHFVVVFKILIKLRTLFSAVGGVMFLIAYILLSSLTPLRIIQKPKYLILVWPKK